MATTPPNSDQPSKIDQQRELEQQVLMREVDEAVRTDEALNAWRKYGKPALAGAVLGLALFGGWLFWQNRQEEAQAQQSTALVQAMDELQGGNLAQAETELAAISDNPDNVATVRASALMLRAAIALQQERLEDAVGLYDRVINDGEAPQVLRDASLVRLVTANYDRMDKQQVVDRLHTLATPGNPWFGSAGELVAHAYLEQGKTELAGPLLVSIAKDEEAPESVRARARQLAGSLGFDAIEDVNELVGDAPTEADSAAAAPPAAAAAPAQ